MTPLTRITLDPDVMGGKPCVRGLGITVGTVVGLVGAGRTVPEIVAAYPVPPAPMPNPRGTRKEGRIQAMEFGDTRLEPRKSVKRADRKRNSPSVKTVERDYEAFSKDAFTGAGTSIATKRSAANK